MYLWDLTMNVLTCMTMVVSVGLCVDFSAHIVHFYLSSQGTPRSRLQETMTRCSSRDMARTEWITISITLTLATRVGPAVFNGGISTLLAFVLLATSSSYVFLSFFKIFLLICLLGLTHGLLVLPVLLVLVNPPSRGVVVQEVEVEMAVVHRGKEAEEEVREALLEV